MIKNTFSLKYNPTLESILMVEQVIKEESGNFTKHPLWKKLPKKMMYQTFCVIIDYLLESGKISLDKERKLGWIYNPALAKKYFNRKDLSWENETKVKNPIRRRKNKNSVQQTKKLARRRMALCCAKPSLS